MRVFKSSWICASLMAICVLSACILSRPVQAQNIGNNAVYTGTSCCTGTAAFIDAGILAQVNGTNICATIYNIFTSTTPAYPASGAVIDARGVSSSAFTCTGTPWLQSGGSFANVPSTILLPAGTIAISQTWAMPSNTHLVGVGDSPTAGTILQAASGFSGAMLQLGNASSPCCTAVSVENLVLDGFGRSGVNGILNTTAQDFSYVDHVSLYQILGTGLSGEAGSGAGA
ncbi:MAG: hypothetical protein LAO09_15985 [Acidobacteriia bacterium]|nr:hypothetical protein [Terriglobia bacterium]